MGDAAELKLTLRLVPADGKPADPVVLDDIVRLIRQAKATAPAQAPQVTAPAAGFRKPDADPGGLESKIKHRIEQASAESRTAVEKRAETAKLPDAPQKLADEARQAAERVVAAVQRAILQRVAVRVPDPGDVR